MCAVLLTMVKAGGACSDMLVHAAFAGVLLVNRSSAGAPEGRLLHAIVIQGCQAGVALPGDSNVVPVIVRPESRSSAQPWCQSTADRHHSCRLQIAERLLVLRHQGSFQA